VGATGLACGSIAQAGCEAPRRSASTASESPPPPEPSSTSPPHCLAARWNERSTKPTLALCAAHALERRQTNVRLAGLEVDFLFAAQRLVVEVDGYRLHRTRKAFERDRERDAVLARAGYGTLRFTYRQVTGSPAEVVKTIRSSA
jgi:hypothetical protein